MSVEFTDSVLAAIGAELRPVASIVEPASCCAVLARLLNEVPGIRGCAVWTPADLDLCADAALPALPPGKDGFECLYASPRARDATLIDVTVRVGEVAWLQMSCEPEVAVNANHARIEAALERFSYILHRALLRRALRRERVQRDYAETRLGELRARGDGAMSYRAMGHDFNNILAIILGFAELARDHLEEGDIGEIHGYLSEVRIAGERGRDAVAAMLAFARGGADDRAIDIAAPIAETVRLAAGMMPPNVKLELQASSFALPEVSIDADDIGQICLQLCVRGREQLERDGVVRLALDVVRSPTFLCGTCGQRVDDGEWVRLSVRDLFAPAAPAGPADARGPDPVQITKGNTTSADTLSSGGVDDLAHRHGGHLLYAGELNRDRRVQVYLPVARLRDAAL